MLFRNWNPSLTLVCRNKIFVPRRRYITQPLKEEGKTKILNTNYRQDCFLSPFGERARLNVSSVPGQKVKLIFSTFADALRIIIHTYFQAEKFCCGRGNLVPPREAVVTAMNAFRFLPFPIPNPIEECTKHEAKQEIQREQEAAKIDHSKNLQSIFHSARQHNMQVVNADNAAGVYIVCRYKTLVLHC